MIHNLIWKPLAIGMTAALLLVSAGTAGGWWLAARDRDAARIELAAEKALSAQYRDSIAEQNRAVDVLAIAKSGAEARGLAAQQVAAANGKRLDLALQRTAGNVATTCTEAMPMVDEVLEAIR